MAREIERKFLLASAAWRSAAEAGVRMVQGYADTGPAELTLRFRLAGEGAFLTLKGRAVGLVRSEFEYPIPVADCREMLDEFCGGRLVEKTRYRVPFAGFIWEVDEYHGANSGLFTAELEIPDPETVFARPDWLGREVTGDPRYTNSALSRLPWSRWPEREKS